MARRNEFGSSWWAKRWISVLESLGWDTRLRRGRSYARAGNVLDIEVFKGRICAHVQGSRPRPYSVTIDIATLSDAEWDRVIERLSGQALFAARLLSGEIPENIEEAFEGSHVSLFPRSRRDINTSCSCPDWANPCKHIAAVCYLLGEEFDRDPFLIFRMRGRTREEVIQALRERRTSMVREEETAKGAPSEDQRPETEPAAWVKELFDHEPEPLQYTLESFWRYDRERLAEFGVSISPAAAPDGLARRLGEPGFLKMSGNRSSSDESIKLEPRPREQRTELDKEEGFVSYLARCYKEVSEKALRLAYPIDGGTSRT